MFVGILFINNNLFKCSKSGDLGHLNLCWFGFHLTFFLEGFLISVLYFIHFNIQIIFNL